MNFYITGPWTVSTGSNNQAVTNLDEVKGSGVGQLYVAEDALVEDVGAESVGRLDAVDVGHVLQHELVQLDARRAGLGVGALQREEVPLLLGHHKLVVLLVVLEGHKSCKRRLKSIKELTS